MPSNHLIVFVKAPRPGLVKTRLAQSMGDEAACRAYSRMVEELLERLDRISNVELRFSPDEATAEIVPWLRSDWSMNPQGPGDLGRRLDRAFADAFNGGARRVVVIGSDCPAVGAEDIQDAWAALASHDVVIGPALDGGYWLIGLRKPCPTLFERIPWSTGAVFRETCKRAAEGVLRVKPLRELPDVDTEADWKRYAGGDGRTGRLTR